MTGCVRRREGHFRRPFAVERLDGHDSGAEAVRRRGGKREWQAGVATPFNLHHSTQQAAIDHGHHGLCSYG